MCGPFAAIRSHVPVRAQEFLRTQPLVFVSAYDAQGQLWTSQVSGAPGFVQAVSPQVVAVRAWPPPGDPLAERLTRPGLVGLLGIEPATRRRIRCNGMATPLPDGVPGFTVRVDEVFANCARHITVRPTDAGPVGAGGQRRRGSTGLDEGQRALVEAADTFVLGTADEDGHLDAAHRGGPPGFVEVRSPGRLRFVDLPGNGMALSLGNLHVESRAAIVFPGWASGRTLALTGTATVDPGGGPAGLRPVVDFTVCAWTEWV